MFLGLEYATLIWETSSSAFVSFSAASTMDLTDFFGMLFLPYFVWTNSRLGLLRMSSGGSWWRAG